MNSTSLIVMCLICVATSAAPLDGENHKPTTTTAAAAEVKIPPYIRKIYNKMSQAMEQDDLHTSLKYLRTVQAVHWLEPATHSKYTTSIIVTQVNNILYHLYTLNYANYLVVYAASNTVNSFKASVTVRRQ